ncbi:hypothetical protein BaRGS_00012740 [Batillaria attramentaria]|uniref:Uncharacterized protein n=1 Tax=Batillaria attramentaria TaxID=370345 RepID=A0ABD0L9G7_9CAEN
MMEPASRKKQNGNNGASYDLRPSKVQIIRRLSMETYMVRIYAGPLSQECDFVSVEADKTSPVIDIVQAAARKLRLPGSPSNFELAEVFSSGGQLCKERRLEDMDYPVGIQLLWPKIINAEVDRGMGLFTGYRFYIRRKDPEVSRTCWVECKDQSVVDTFLMSFLEQPVGAREYQDLCNLPDLNEQTLMANLKARFNNSNIYTYVGSILIALNPFKFFPIYNPKYVKMYQNKRLGELPPHIFAIADAAYHTMLQTRQNQCIVISGESGSGKTESTNFLLHHLTALSHKGLHGSGVEQTILGAGPVLEAFGNAKTVHNNNSSRFGKFIQVNYKENGMVHGAIVEKYLLEKSRIVSQAKSERNYHVFYYMLAGADDREREALSLSRPEDYRYLSQSQCFSLEGVDEEHEFARLKQSMEMVGFSPETQRKIFCVLSAVLHLGNVEFKKVKERTVMEALTQKRTTAGDETFVINYKMDDAVATRDAMAKCIYGALFDWIVLKVNQALLAKKHNSEHEGNSIGVLDIFGFEDFGRNSFEQFCINYANEHLQYYFNQHIFKFEQEEYQREGIQWKNIEFIDNTGSLELFSKKPSGLFYLLDEECNFPGATNDTLLSKFTHNHRGNPYYQVPQLKEGAFNIVHYAGKVKYYVKDFREKNSDLVRQEIVGTLKKSSMAFVRELMGIDPVAVLRWSVVRAFFRCFFAFIRAGERFRKTGGAAAAEKKKKRLSDSQLHEKAFNENLLKQRELAASIPPNVHEVDETSAGGTDESGQDVDLVRSRRHVMHEELLMYSSIESNLPPSDAKVIRRARKLLMKNKSFRPRPRPSLSFRDIKALKAIASRTMFSGIRAPCQFDDEIVLRQLRYTGMLATVKIRQSGYNYRLLFEEFIQLYQILLPRGLLSSKIDVADFLKTCTSTRTTFRLGRARFLAALVEKQLAVERRAAEEKARQRHQEELQSSASDEGVVDMAKAPSHEELEERAFSPVQRRDSEESSGILEDSDSEAVSSIEPKSQRESLVSPPPTPTSDSSRPDSGVVQAVKGDRRDVYLVEAESSASGRVQELAKTFQSPQRDDELSPQGKEGSSPVAAGSARDLFEPEHLQAIEEVLTKGKTSRHEHPEQDDSRAAPDASTHLSPFHKARKHIKNFMGGARRKKDATDSDEESEEVHPPTPTITSPMKKVTDLGIAVLPPGTVPTLSAPRPLSQDATGSSVMRVEEGVQQTQQAPPSRAKRKKKQRNRGNRDANQQQSAQSRSNVKFSGTSEWQYSDDMKITDVQDLHALDEFISQKCRELFKDHNRRETIFDKIFKGALDEFGRELKTIIAVEMQHDEVAVKYRDLFEKFKNLLVAEMRKEQTEATLVMALNAFRGFLDEFMKQQPARRRERKEERKQPVKRDKHKKDNMVEHMGHKFLQVQFSIPTFCEYCSSLIWIMDKGQVCQVCKYTCHKKCSTRSILPCRGSSPDQGPANARVFGAPLESLLKEGQKIPLVVDRLISAIEMHGLFTVGLYRKCGAAPKARELRSCIESGFETVNLDDYPVHVLTTVLKSFFRELPEPLLTFELYDDFLRSPEIKDRKEQVQCLFAVIEKLPKPNYDLFERLIFHLAKVAMHEDSTKMSVNGLAIIFAPCLLRSNKKIQAQESLNQVPKQTSCIEIILSEELATVKSKLADISTLESAEKTAEERLSFVRASLRGSRVKSDLQRPPLVAQEKNLTSKLPMLEARQASSDEDMLTGDEMDSIFDPSDAPDDVSVNEEYAVAFDVPGDSVQTTAHTPPFVNGAVCTEHRLDPETACGGL